MAQIPAVERESRLQMWENGSAPEGAGNTASGADPASLDNTEEHRLMPTLEPPTEGVDNPPEMCATCLTETGTQRYCALSRCYCGHPDCPAFDSWIDLKALPVAGAPRGKAKDRPSAWSDREGATWIDSL